MLNRAGIAPLLTKPSVYVFLAFGLSSVAIVAIGVQAHACTLTIGIARRFDSKPPQLYCSSTFNSMLNLQPRETATNLYASAGAAMQ